MPYIPIRETNFYKGYNDKIPAEHLEPGMLADALNCFIRTGEIEKRTGYTLIADDLGTVAWQGLRGVRFADATKELIGVVNGNIYKWTGSGNWSLITGGTGVLKTTGFVDIVVANNNVYFFDGTNTVPKYDATSITTVAAIPKGNIAKWFHNLLFVAQISGSPNNVQMSDLGNPENFTTGISATLAINPNDGDYITALDILKDELLIFKSQRVWSLTGFGTATLTVSDLNERISGFGTLSSQGTVNTGNDVLYMSFLGDIPHVRSIQRTRFGILVDAGIVSDAIETSLNGMNKGALDIVTTLFDGRNAWFAVANGASAFNNRVYMMDTVTRGWVRHTGINAACWDIFAIGTTIQVYFGEADADSKVYRMDTSTSDNGTAINFLVNSRRYGGTRPEVKKKWKYVQVSAEDTGNFDLDVNYSVDGFTFDDLGTMNLTGAGSVFDNIILDTSKLGATDLKKKRFSLPKLNRYYFQLQLTDNSTTSSISIRDWEIYHFPRIIREV